MPPQQNSWVENEPMRSSEARFTRILVDDSGLNDMMNIARLNRTPEEIRREMATGEDPSKFFVSSCHYRSNTAWRRALRTARDEICTIQ